MYPPSRSQYLDFLSAEWDVTHYLEFRNSAQKLVAVAVTDRLQNGLSAIYTFFDPDENRRSLGVYGVISQVEWAKEIGLPYLYLGYWIKQCQKMNYKTDYQPCQLMVNGNWITVTSTPVK